MFSSRAAIVFTVAAVVICQLVGQSWAARRVDAQLRARETMRKRRDQDMLQKRNNMPLDVPQLFQLTKGESLEAVTEVNDAYGARVERLQEFYKGIKVYDTVVTIHKTKDGAVTGEASGEFIQGIDNDLPDTEVAFSNEQVLNIALAEEGDNINDARNVKISEQIFIDSDDQAHLVNVLSYLIEDKRRPFYIIDVKSGKVLKHWQALTTYPCCERKYNASGGNERAGKITYGKMPYCLTPTITNGSCYLENEYVRVIDDRFSYSETAYFDCKEGPDDAVNGAYSPLADAFFYGTVVGKMFEEWFDSVPFENDTVALKVHYGSYTENAFWDGEYCLFGDGYTTFYPLTELDIVAHEIGHGVTEFNSGLEYYGESGGLNEAFSDIMGEAAEDYLLKSDFMTGYSIMKRDPYLREFERPENDNVSIGHMDDMYSYIDVHYSSGIYRRVWYVVVKEEETPVRDAFSVFLHANKMYWHPTSSFYDASCGVLKAAVDLGFDTLPYRKAFKDVGIEFCTSVSEIPVLNVNETRYGVIVSDTIKPRFITETPEYADMFFVDVNSNTSRDVMITVTTGGWKNEDGVMHKRETGWTSTDIWNSTDGGWNTTEGGWNTTEENKWNTTDGGWNSTEENRWNTTDNGWNRTEKSGGNITSGVEVVAEDVNYVTVPASANNKFYIELSLSEATTDHDECDEEEDNSVAAVSITAGYFTLRQPTTTPDYNHYDYTEEYDDDDDYYDDYDDDDDDDDDDDYEDYYDYYGYYDYYK